MLINLIKKFKNKLLLATVFSALSSAVSIWLLAEINNNIARHAEQNLTQLMGLFLLLVGVLFAVSFLSQYVLARLGTAFVYQLRTFLLQQVSKVNYQNLEQVGGHRVLATLTTDVANISHGLAILPVFAVNLATILFCLVYLCFQSATLFALLMAGLLAGVGVSAFIMRIGRDKFIELREKEDHLFAVFKTLVDGSKELNINQHRRNHFYGQQAQPCVDAVQGIELKAKTYWILSESLLRALIFLVLALVLFVAHLYLNVETVVLSSFILFTTYIIGPISFIQSTYQALVKGRIAYRKIQALNLDFESPLQTDDHHDDNSNWGELSLQAVSYQYTSNNSYPFKVGPIDLCIKPGENIFICGGNGSGKSTFAKVLVGLYQPQSGQIQLSGQTIEEHNKQWYRNHFSTIFSDFHLFDHVLNKQGQPVADGALDQHLKQLQLSDKVTVEKGRVSSTRLSQGQRKRLAMLMAYAEDAAIYLFDEWAADQDPTYRAYFYEQLLPALNAQGKTLIVITHDDKYFHLADKLLKFDNGQMTVVPAGEAAFPLQYAQ